MVAGHGTDDPSRPTGDDAHHIDTTAAIDVRSLSFTHPDGTVALDDVDLRVEPGQHVALLGPNGAGKTTLVLHLNGLYTPRSGTVEIGGHEVRNHLAEVRRRVGLVFQDPDDQLFLGTVRDDVAFGPANLGMRGAALVQRVEEALDAVGLVDVAERAPHHLSGGERRRVAIATVLAMQPDVLVLDEPTAGLDPASVHELAEVLDSLPVTRLVVTHDLPFAARTCDRAVVMDRGRVVADGPTAGVLGDRDLLEAHRLTPPFGWRPPRMPTTGRGSAPEGGR